MMPFNPACRIDSLSAFCDFRATVDVLRLDELHSVVSGNKWFKLQVYLQDAFALQKTLLTFGGAYSNHIVATAAAAARHQLKSVGIIRGEEPRTWSPTLLQAKSFGMELYFTSRSDYREKQIPEAVFHHHQPDELYVVPEGGYGLDGVAGAKEIVLQNATNTYTHLVSAVGTGTTLAGLVAAADSSQTIVGIPVLKNEGSLAAEINQLLPQKKQNRFTLHHSYHFGGYAKKHTELFRFMNALYEKTGVPTDFVYTAKAFYAVFDLLEKQIFSPADQILLIHTGGLQGNRSLPKGTLIFG